MPVAGQVSLGTAQAIVDRGEGWLIGVDNDWRLTAEEYADIILLSIMKRMDNSVFSVTEMTLNDEFKGGLFVSNLENGGVGLTEIADGAVSDEVLETLVELEEMIIAGDIITFPELEME
jgi:basic membrane protein A